MAAAVATQAIQETKVVKKQASKDLQKTRLCVYNLEGKCGYGSNCTFAHASTEIRGVPDLKKTQLCTKFLEGNCSDENCSYAHGKEELRNSPNFKKNICKWYGKGTCRNGAKCGFAHGTTELSMLEPPPGFRPLADSKIAPPPGLEKMGPEADWEVSSTEAPSSEASQAESGSMAGASPADLPLFQLAGARGAAPLKQQVALMSSAVSALQSKLSMLEDMVLQSQVTKMQQSIQQLNEQCWALEAGMCPAEQSQPAELKKSPLNAKAAPFVPSMAGNDWASDDSTSVGSD